MQKLGERTIHFDCDVIQADGGTRTASITGAYVAMVDAVNTLLQKGLLTETPIRDSVGAISVGVYQGVPVLDLDYIEDSDCDTDMNVVMTGSGGFVEIQGTAEGEPFSRDAMNEMLDLAAKGIAELSKLQQQALAK
jgi:ribonuclease PH